MALRRLSLEDEPLAFGASPNDDRAANREEVLDLLSGTGERATFGAFDPELIGIVGVMREQRLKRRHKAFVWGAFVHSEHRRKGIGEALMHAAIAEASSWDGVSDLGITVSTDAEAAHRLYERLGFVRWGMEPEALVHEGKSTAEHKMSLRLPER